MYICVCNALREKDVRRAGEELGLSSAAVYFDHRNIRPQCGKCVPYLHDMLRETSGEPKARGRHHFGR